MYYKKVIEALSCHLYKITHHTKFYYHSLAHIFTYKTAVFDVNIILGNSQNAGPGRGGAGAEAGAGAGAGAGARAGVGVRVSFFFFQNFFVSIFVVILPYCYFLMSGIFPSSILEISQKM